MIEGGKVYVGSQAQFLASLWEMSSYFSADQEPATTAALNKLIQALQVPIQAVLRSRSIFDRLWVFFSPAPATALYKKVGFQVSTINIFFITTSLLPNLKFSFIYKYLAFYQCGN